MKVKLQKTGHLFKSIKNDHDMATEPLQTYLAHI
jgi:hypothetical protein